MRILLLCFRFSLASCAVSLEPFVSAAVTSDEGNPDRIGTHGRLQAAATENITQPTYQPALFALSASLMSSLGVRLTVLYHGGKTECPLWHEGCSDP